MKGATFGELLKIFGATFERYPSNLCKSLDQLKLLDGGKEGGGKYSDFLGRSVQRDPRTLSFYHSMFSCNFTTLAIL